MALFFLSFFSIKNLYVGWSLPPDTLWVSSCLIIDITKISIIFGSTMEIIKKDLFYLLTKKIRNIRILFISLSDTKNKELWKLESLKILWYYSYHYVLLSFYLHTILAHLKHLNVLR